MKNLLQYAELVNSYRFEFSDEEIDYLIAKNNTNINNELSQTKLLKENHIDKLIKMDNDDVWFLMQNYQLTENQINIIIKSKHRIQHIISTQNLSKKLLDKFIDLDTYGYYLAQHTNLNIEQINKLLNSKDSLNIEGIINELIKNPCVPEEIKQKIIDNKIKEEVFK